MFAELKRFIGPRFADSWDLPEYEINVIATSAR